MPRLQVQVIAVLLNDFNFIEWTSFRKLSVSDFLLICWSPETLFSMGNAYRVHLDLFFCEKVDFLPSASLDHGGGSGILG